MSSRTQPARSNAQRGLQAAVTKILQEEAGLEFDGVNKPLMTLRRASCWGYDDTQTVQRQRSGWDTDPRIGEDQRQRHASRDALEARDEQSVPTRWQLAAMVRAVPLQRRMHTVAVSRDTRGHSVRAHPAKQGTTCRWRPYAVRDGIPYMLLTCKPRKETSTFFFFIFY